MRAKAYFLCKMVSIRQMVRVQRRPNFLNTLRPVGRFLKLILTYPYNNKCNEIKVNLSDGEKHTSY